MFRWGLVQDPDHLHGRRLLAQLAALRLCWFKGSFRSFIKNAASTRLASSDALVTEIAKRILLFSQPG